MSKVYVIGSMMEAQEMHRACEALCDLKHQVRCVKPIKTTYEAAVNDCFKGIEWCDILVVIAKSDGSIDEAVTHELCFAEFLDKSIYIIQSRR